jgi:hypothetical protein
MSTPVGTWWCCECGEKNEPPKGTGIITCAKPGCYHVSVIGSWVVMWRLMNERLNALIVIVSGEGVEIV